MRGISARAGAWMLAALLALGTPATICAQEATAQEAEAAA